MMSHVAFLERFYDGPIPPEALRHARAMDEAEQADEEAEAARAMRLAVVRDHQLPPAPPETRVAQMAATMVERATVTGACTDLDLEAAGFTADEIRGLAPAARAQALRATADRAA